MVDASTSLSLKDRDLAQWLDNKLGASDELWGSKNAATLLSKEILESIDSCFQDLQPNVKLKLLLGILHLSRRNVEQWQDDIENVISLSLQDTDEWVQTMAEVLRDYCSSNGLCFSADDDSSHFARTLAEIRKIGRQYVKTAQLLPFDCCFLSKNCVTNHWSSATQQTSKRHFALKRRPKSAALRVELLQKATDVANRPKTESGHSLSAIVPIRARNMLRKMDDKSPLRGIPTVSASKSSGGFSTEKKITRPLVKRDGGAKLIEISETPQALKIKKKQWEAEQRIVKAQAKEEQKHKMAELKEQRKAQRIAAAQAPKPIPIKPIKVQPNDVIEDGVIQMDTVTPVYAAAIMPRTNVPDRPPVSTPSVPVPTIRSTPSVSNSNNFMVVRPTNVPNASVAIRQAPPSGVIQPPTSTPRPPQPNVSAAPKTVYHITKEVMQQAQDMFRTANKLSRPEKALILGFMAGNRENPCPQMGHILTVRLSESTEIQPTSDGRNQEVVAVETFFQMNYENGEWKRLKKIRPLKPDEMTQMTTGLYNTVNDL